MANSKRTKTKVAPVQQQGITPQNMAMIQQMQDMQAAENQQKILTQEADNKQHDPDSEQTPDPQMIDHGQRCEKGDGNLAEIQGV